MPKNIGPAGLRQLVVCVSCILLLLSAGCQRRDDVIAGLDIPIPEKMTKNPDKPMDPVPGFDEGQVSYQGKIAPEEIFTFYQQTMAAKGWRPTARFANQKDQIAYTKQNKLVLIRYNQVPDGTTIMTLLVRTEEPAK